IAEYDGNDGSTNIVLPFSQQAAVVINAELETRRHRGDFLIWHGKVEDFLTELPREPIFDLVVTSPPYNLGKEYEKRDELRKYKSWQKQIIDEIVPRLKPSASICWQVGNFVDNGQIVPLDIEFAPIFREHGLQLRNRIIWHFGHGLHTKRRFSGRYE